jgi:hypothetical protein
MQESDAMTTSAGPGQVVNKLKALRATAGQRRIEVGDAVTDMVNARAALGEKFRDRGIFTERFEELDLSTLELQVDDAGPVGFFGSANGDVEDVAVERQRRFDISHSDANVRDARLHGVGT